MDEKVFIGFYLEKLYFMPHFEPVIEELRRRGISYTVIIHKNLHRDELNQRAESIKYCTEQHLNYCLEEKCPPLQYLVFGASPHPVELKYDKSVIIFHGTWGGKAVYLNQENNNADIRFIDGKFYEDILGALYPDQVNKLCISGYSKLDSYFKFTEQDKITLLKKYGLDPNKKTILYAPTFYPSSILKLKNNFPETFRDYNIIIKPHSNIFLRSKYRKTLHHIRNWEKYGNVYIPDFHEANILPFMHCADLMISDISSAVYEFAGLGKPVIINMFLHYRWHHLFLRYKLEKRLDKAHFYLWNVGDIANNYQEMVSFCFENLQNPAKNQKQREQFVNYVIGQVDGKVSERIVNRLLEK